MGGANYPLLHSIQNEIRYFPVKRENTITLFFAFYFLLSSKMRLLKILLIFPFKEFYIRLFLKFENFVSLRASDLRSQSNDSFLGLSLPVYKLCSNLVFKEVGNPSNWSIKAGFI